MKVICVCKSLKGVSYDFTLGAGYAVLAIEASDFRILDDRGVPALFPPELFEIADPTRPTDWISRIEDEAEYASPPEIAAPGFFEDFFDKKPSALTAFYLFINARLLNAG